MIKDFSEIKAVIFDYGNTLVELGEKQVKILNQALFKTLSELFGDCDMKIFTEIRKSQILAPYGTEEFIENNRKGICVELVRKLYGIVPDDKQIEKMLETKHHSFVDTVSLPEFVLPILHDLKKKYRLAFISNYPCPQSIKDSLKKNGLGEIFESVVISGEIGHVKPHPSIFRQSLKELDMKPENCVYVGDNWLADIQGAKRIGMKAIHTTQYVSYENFKPFDGDYMPDAVITHLQLIAPLADKFSQYS